MCILVECKVAAAMTRVLALALFSLVAASAVSAQSFGLTCETSGDRRRCFDHHGYLSTAERQGDYVHGHDNRGGAWTTWTHEGHTETWPSR
jgi:hypothetical protein